MGTKPYYLGIDVGGTTIKMGLVDHDGCIIADTTVQTDAHLGIEEGLSNIDVALNYLLSTCMISLDDIFSIGIVAPGIIDFKAGKVLHPCNLPSWHNQPVRELISRKYGKPTALQNDANAAALAEYCSGAGIGHNLLLFWSIGTGLGSGIVIDGKILAGNHAHGGECGHIIIEHEHGRLCTTGQYGTLEAYVGGWAIIARTKEKLDSGVISSLKDPYLAGIPITPLMIMQAAQANDEFAISIITDTAKYLATGTVSMMHAIDPDIILVGGGVNFGQNETEIGRLFMQTLRDEVKRRCFPMLRDKTKIEWAQLGTNAGFIGAAACARREFNLQSVH